jgi:F-type H+-transporting ATPase subunit delta
MPRIAENYGRALYRATAGMSDKEAAEAVERFVAMLEERRELQLAPKIIEAFAKEARRKGGVREVRFASAQEPTAGARKKLAGAFAKALGAEVEMRWETDPSLIAGAVIRYDDVLIDASVKGSLDRLKKQLS